MEASVFLSRIHYDLLVLLRKAVEFETNAMHFGCSNLRNSDRIPRETKRSYHLEIMNQLAFASRVCGNCGAETSCNGVVLL